ncbi:MAG: glutamate--tRNA ligase, partial [Candidatus Aenigmatarchaeota archaeon]
VPYDYKIRVKVIMPDKVIKGYGELNLRNLKPGSIIQFERFGFVRTERISKNAITAIFSHG